MEGFAWDTTYTDAAWRSPKLFVERRTRYYTGGRGWASSMCNYVMDIGRVYSTVGRRVMSRQLSLIFSPPHPLYLLQLMHLHMCDSAAPSNRSTFSFLPSVRYHHPFPPPPPPHASARQRRRRRLLPLPPPPATTARQALELRGRRGKNVPPPQNLSSRRPCRNCSSGTRLESRREAFVILPRLCGWFSMVVAPPLLVLQKL